MSGLSLLRVLRKECRVPVIVISGRSSDADRIIGLNAGANDYIVKPFSLGELVARIDCHLRKEMRFDARKKPAV
jgi:DNA-binding response OmpR family regulator